MNIKADQPVDFAAALAGYNESNTVYIDRRQFKGKLRYVILDSASAIVGVVTSAAVGVPGAAGAVDCATETLFSPSPAALSGGSGLAPTRPPALAASTSHARYGAAWHRWWNSAACPL